MITIICNPAPKNKAIGKEIEMIVSSYLRTQEKYKATITVGLKPGAEKIDYINFGDRNLTALQQDDLRRLLRKFY